MDGVPKNSTFSILTFPWDRFTLRWPIIWDHQEEINQQIEDDLQYADGMRRAAGETPLVARLKANGLL